MTSAKADLEEVIKQVDAAAGAALKASAREAREMALLPLCEHEGSNARVARRVERTRCEAFSMVPV